MEPLEVECAWNDDLILENTSPKPEILRGNLADIERVLFKDPDFYSAFNALKNDEDMKYQEWNEENGVFGRRVTSLVKIPPNNARLPGIPNKTRVVENQSYQIKTEENLLQVQLVSCSLDIPYGRDFRLQVKIQFKQLDNAECETIISAGVNWIKEPWCIGSIIKRGVLQGSQDTFQQWLDLAKKFMNENLNTTNVEQTVPEEEQREVSIPSPIRSPSVPRSPRERGFFNHLRDTVREKIQKIQHEIKIDKKKRIELQNEKEEIPEEIEGEVDTEYEQEKNETREEMAEETEDEIPEEIEIESDSYEEDVEMEFEMIQETDTITCKGMIFDVVTSENEWEMVSSY
eukprot:TRINITY_DN1795_c0_g1_i1.p1 TRINITY_DN1795_c0_g1~~TRINITY_DN1795_c0_g1_i1.p1  ORF type:complete len:345 (-),score=105.82 TRINITY_DN1795_c0_g1_i1:71-1105(-)